MPEPDIAAAPAAANTAHTVTINGEQRTIERISGLKLSRALAIVRAAGQAVPKIVSEWGEFRTEYERTHNIELSRAQALMRYGPRAIFDEAGDPVLDEAGQVRMAPGALAHMTDADWAASGNVLAIPSSPSTSESIAAVFPTLIETAEEHVYALLTLFLTSNGELKRLWRSGEHKEALEAAQADLLADSYADELLELAVVCGELVDEQFSRKAAALGDRLGKALRLFGMDPATLSSSSPTSTEQAETPSETLQSSPTSSVEPSSSSATSSTDSPAPTDGDGASPSTPPPTSSSSSGDASTETASSSSAPDSPSSASTPTTLATSAA